MTVALHGPGLYAVTVLEDGRHNCIEMDPTPLIAADTQATAEALCHLMMVIAATWRKLQILSSATGSKDDLFTKSHAEAIRNGARMAAHYIRIFDRERDASGAADGR